MIADDIQTKNRNVSVANRPTGCNWLNETRTKRSIKLSQDRKQAKRGSWEQAAEMWRRVESYDTHFCWAPRRIPTPALEMLWRNIEHARLRTTTENEKDNTNFCVCFSRPVRVYFCLSKVDSFHTLFLSLYWLLISVVKSKLRIKRLNRQRFMC